MENEKQPLPRDEFEIYLSWPESLIRSALDEFKHGKNGMYNGAGIVELEAGLHCLDFLARASIFSEETQILLEGASLEADMRIQLLVQLECDRLTEVEIRMKALQLVTALDRQFRRLLDWIREIDGEDVVRIVNERIERRYAEAGAAA